MKLENLSRRKLSPSETAEMVYKLFLDQATERVVRHTQAPDEDGVRLSVTLFDLRSLTILTEATNASLVVYGSKGMKWNEDAASYYVTCHIS